MQNLPDNNPNTKLLLDSGSNLNLIIISSILDQVMVYEDTIYYLKGINEQLVPTLKRTTISI